MANRLPLVLVNGVVQQLPANDSLLVGMSDAELDGGVSTESRIISPAQLKAAVQRWTRDARTIQFVEDFGRSYSPAKNLVYANSGTSSSVLPTTTVFAGHHGNLLLTTGDTATGYGAVYGSQQFNYSSWPIVTKNSCPYAEWEVIFRTVNVLSNGTDRYSMLAGAPGGVDTATMGFGIYYRDDVNGGNWQIFSRGASNITVADSGVAVVATTWTNAKIVWNGTSLTFYINGVNVGSISTNIPTNFIGPGMVLQKVLGTTSLQSVLDRVSFYAEVNAR